MNVCWKCGLSGHVGARCNQPTLTFDALAGVQAVTEEGGGGAAGGVRSWAHVVRSGSGQSLPNPVTQSELEVQENLKKKAKEDEIALTELVFAVNKGDDKVLNGSDAAVETSAAAVSATARSAAREIAEGAAVSDSAVAGIDAATVGSKTDDVDAVKGAVVGGGVAEQDALPGLVASDHDSDSSMDVTGSESVDPDLVFNIGKVRNKSKNKQKYLKSNPVDESSEGDMDISVTEKQMLVNIPWVKGVTPRFDSQATSKAGLTPASEASDQSFNSQATSKAGLSLQGSDFDPDLSVICGGSALKKIVPGNESSASGDSSPRQHKPAASHLDSGEQCSDLPGNDRSVKNRFLKAILKDNVDKNLD